MRIPLHPKTTRSCRARSLGACVVEARPTLPENARAARARDMHRAPPAPPAPYRRIALIWHRNFSRRKEMELLAAFIGAQALESVTKAPGEPDTPDGSVNAGS